MSQQSLLIIAVFIAYFFLHSLSASLWMKRRVRTCCPALSPYYRLIFNISATLLALPLIYLAWRYPGEPLWQWPGIAGYLADAVAIIALITLLYSLRLYDMQEFMGFRQAQDKVTEVKDMEHFQISPFHRYVRHPWYFLILVIIWSRDLSTNQLLIYSLVTLYLIIGSRLEENKLIAYHGEVYRRYRKKVAGLFPLPWKTLSSSEAQALLDDYDKQ